MALDDTAKVGLAVTGALALYKLFAPGKGAMTDANARPTVSWAGDEDFRVRITVPESYLTAYTSGGRSNQLSTLKGIIFPYTPSISLDHSANYTNQSPMHSNFTFYSYRNSQVGAISISGRFSVENDDDAQMYLSTVHLLKSLTKMRVNMDVDAGAPPPVCRLFAYGDYMLNNVPVVVSSFKQEFPTDVDYYRMDSNGFLNTFGQNFVPVLSNLSLTLLPMYSRAEQARFGVDSYLNNPALRRGGFL